MSYVINNMLIVDQSAVSPAIPNVLFHSDNYLTTIV